jgi:acetolactate synthase small subunit
VTFVIGADNRADVLARVVLLFHRLNVEIEALYMVRRPSSETMRIHLTIKANDEACPRLEANLYKVVQVTSVETERRAKEFLTETLDGSLKTRQ